MVTATVSRSDDPDMLSDTKRMLAEARVDAMLAQRSAQGPARRPKGHGGLAVRSEVTCADCIKVGATPEQSFLIHQDPDAPFERQLTDLDDAAMAALGPAPGWQAERRDGRAPMIYR